MDWWEILLGGGIGGGLLTTGINKILSRRKDSADSSKAEAEAIQAYQVATKTANEMIATASDEIEKARKNGEVWYSAMKAMRDETDAKIAEVRAEHTAELVSLRSRNEQLTDTVEAMARQLDQRTIDQAEVEWAKKRNVEYEEMREELTSLREQVREIPHLRREVARLTTVLEDEQRQARANEELLRKDLNQGGPNG